LPLHASAARAPLPELAEQASRTWSLPLAACRRYLLEECRYDPARELRPALLAFRDAASALGLCEAELAPSRSDCPDAPSDPRAALPALRPALGEPRPPRMPDLRGLSCSSATCAPAA
jgi:hypothetical protein